MKKVTLLIAIGCLLLLNSNSLAQADHSKESNKGIVPLKIGEYVPDINFSEVKKYPFEKAKLSDFVKNKKLVILDFWNRFCSSCIDKMPDVEQLNNQFREDIQIVYVLNPRDAPQYDYYIKRFPNVRSLRLPMIITDTLLYHKLFAHQGDPYQVWLDKNLRVIASSDQVKLTSENISSFLNGNLSGFPASGQVTRSRMHFSNTYQSILDNGRLNDRILNYSILTRSVKGFSGGIGDVTYKDSITKQDIGFRFINQSLDELYLSTRPNDETLLIVSSNQKFKQNGADRNNSEDLFCYESILPKPYSFEAAQIKLKYDLDAYFKLSSKIEVIDTNCLILSISDPEKYKKLKLREGIKDHNGYRVDRTAHYFDENKNFILKCGGIYDLFTAITKEIGKKYHVVLTNDDPSLELINIDLKISSSFNDPKSLNEQLSKYGISLKEEIRPIKFMVVRDLKKAN